MRRYFIRSGEINYELTAGVHTIGRDPDCSITVDDNEISRRHAAIVGSDGAFFAVDLNSTNRMRINGMQALEFNLQHGDEIYIGSTRFIFAAEGRMERQQRAAATREMDVQLTERLSSLREGLEECFACLRFIGSLPAAKQIAQRVIQITLALFRANRAYVLLASEPSSIDEMLASGRLLTDDRPGAVVTLDGEAMTRLWKQDCRSALADDGAFLSDESGDETISRLCVLLRDGNDLCIGALGAITVPPSSVVFDLVDRQLAEELGRCVATILVNLSQLED